AIPYHHKSTLFPYTTLFRSDFSSKTSKINVPVLIISGKKDYAIGVNHYKLMKFPQQKVVLINGAHALYAEHTKELYRKVKPFIRSEEHTSELQSRENLVCRL